MFSLKKIKKWNLIIILGFVSANLYDPPQRDAVRQLKPEVLQELASADRDVLGELELAKPGDPSFDSVSAYLPPMKRPRDVVGVKHHPHDIGVSPDASLELSDDVDAPASPVAFFEVGRPPVKFGAAPAGCSKVLLDGMPVVLAQFSHEGIRYRQTMFGYAEGMSPEAELWAYVELEAKNEARGHRSTEIRFRIEPGVSSLGHQKWEFGLPPRASRKIFLKVPFDIKNRKFSEVAASE
ncbi:MAG: hypothetical protein AB1715_13865, partial [Acidobacteriota bacterium]